MASKNEAKVRFTAETGDFNDAIKQANSELGKLRSELKLNMVYGRPIPGGAAQMLRMPLNGAKKLKSLTLRTLSNDVVIGLMGITLQ